MQKARTVVQKYVDEKRPVRLHLGCYSVKLPGFINIDIRPEVDPDVVDDVFTLREFEKNSIDQIYSSHCLEHTTRSAALIALKRYFDLLKPDGVLQLAVPDMEMHFKHYIWYGDLALLRSALWGSQRHPYDNHLTGWDFQTLEKDLLGVGFRCVNRYDWWTTDHARCDDYASSYYPHKCIPQSSNQNRLMSLNVRATK